MPRYFLQQAGIEPERDFKSVAFSGAHDATVAFVAAGRAEAGVLNASVLDKLIESKNPNAEKVRVLVGDAALLRLQLDGAARPRSGADEEAHRRLPQARSGQARDEGDHGPAAGVEVHPDAELELRRHRGRGEVGRACSSRTRRRAGSRFVSLSLEGAGLVHPNGHRALHGVSLSLARGARAAVIGPRARARRR
jgi:hypothetical protein